MSRRQLIDDLRQRLAAALEDLSAVTEDRDRLLTGIEALDDAFVIADASGSVVHRNAPAMGLHEGRHGDAVAADLVDRVLRAACAGEAVEEELTLHGPPRRAFVVRAVPLGLRGRFIGAVALARDVTDLRKVQDVRRDFVANVSHELKTPIGALALLAETLASTDDSETARVLSDQLLRETDRLVRIVDDLLDLSQIEAQEAPTRDRVPVHVLLEDAVERVRPLALARGMTLRYVPPPMNLAVNCDRTKLLGAVTNLLDNAIKYSDEGRTVELRSERDADQIVIVVRDHGIGIPSRDLERIFERFYRVDKARSRVTGGTGLGLSIVRHVAQVHGGDVTVESAEGEGSTFRLALPLAGPADTDVDRHAEAS